MTITHRPITAPTCPATYDPRQPGAYAEAFVREFLRVWPTAEVGLVFAFAADAAMRQLDRNLNYAEFYRLWRAVATEWGRAGTTPEHTA